MLGMKARSDQGWPPGRLWRIWREQKAGRRSGVRFSLSREEEAGTSGGRE